jgi:hypothetical protein
MKKLIAFSLLLAACHRAPSSAPTPSNALGAPDAKTAIGAFITAINAQDLQAMSAVWGDADGPARNQMNADELMKREVVIIQMMKCVRKDFTVISDVVASNNQRSMVVQLNFVPPSKSGDTKPLQRPTNFVTVRDKSGRWLVNTVDLNQVNDACLTRA